jgi:hypothetical protein
VKNLENVRETLLNANQIHLERGLQQGCPFLLLQVLHWLIEFKSWLLKNKNKMSLNINAKHSMTQYYRLKKLPALAGLITAPPSAFDPDSAPVLNTSRL